MRRAIRRALASRWGYILLVLTTATGCASSPEVPIEGLDDVPAYAVGIREPATMSAADADIPPEKSVIGVCVDNQCRAYLIESFTMQPGHEITLGANDASMQALGRHVVNDLIGEMPISVTYCDSSQCARVFTAEDDESLDLAVGGYHEGEMQLLLLGKRFSQLAADAPLKDYPFEITTWEKWKARHPATDIYVGG